jgi:hypothetical protein
VLLTSTLVSLKEETTRVATVVDNKSTYEGMNFKLLEVLLIFINHQSLVFDYFINKNLFEILG